MKDVVIGAASMLLVNAMLLPLVAYGLGGVLHVPVRAGRVEGEPSILLHFRPQGDGTVLEAEVQTAAGDTSPMKPQVIREFSQAIRREIGLQAEAFLAFRSLYGPWISPHSFIAASKDLLQSRIARRCGWSGPQAGDWADKILRPIRS